MVPTWMEDSDLTMPGPAENGGYFKTVSPGRVFFAVLCGQCLDGEK